jgi:ubiquinol-cytochrome c reductase cytochrome b subunit
MNSSSSLLVPFFTLFFKDSLAGFMFIAFVLSGFYFLDPDILGNPDNLIKANPLSTPEHILPE